MDKTHLQPFLDAMHAKNPAALAAHMSDDVTLRSPILPDPVVGKGPVGNLLGAAKRRRRFHGDRRHRSRHSRRRVRHDLRRRCASDRRRRHARCWRRPGERNDDPVASARPDVAMQQLLAPVIGAPVMKLIAA